MQLLVGVVGCDAAAAAATIDDARALKHSVYRCAIHHYCIYISQFNFLLTCVNVCFPVSCAYLLQWILFLRIAMSWVLCFMFNANLVIDVKRHNFPVYYAFASVALFHSVRFIHNLINRRSDIIWWVLNANLLPFVSSVSFLPLFFCCKLMTRFFYFVLCCSLVKCACTQQMLMQLNWFDFTLG